MATAARSTTSRSSTTRAARRAASAAVADAADGQRAERHLAAEVGACTACALASDRAVAVVGDGPLDAALVVVASAPRAHEDLQGRALAGGARNLLDHGLQRVGLDPASVRVTSAVRCRPRADRLPSPAEVAACSTHLRTELDLIAPQVVVSLGAPAAAAVLGRPIPLQRTAGFRLEALRGSATLVPTYDPAAIVRGDRVAAAVFDRHLAVAAAVLDGRLSSGSRALADARAAAERAAAERAAERQPTEPLAAGCS